MNYPTNQLNDAKSIIFRINFVQDIAQDTDYYMLIQFKMSATGFPSSVAFPGDVYPPVYGTCNYYLHGIDDGRAPRFVFSSTRVSGASTTMYEFFLDLGYGVNPGGVSPSRAVMFVNGTALLLFMAH